jgi:hypothetical protein
MSRSGRAPRTAFHDQPAHVIRLLVATRDAGAIGQQRHGDREDQRQPCVDACGFRGRASVRHPGWRSGQRFPVGRPRCRLVLFISPDPSGSNDARNPNPASIKTRQNTEIAEATEQTRSIDSVSAVPPCFNCPRKSPERYPCGGRPAATAFSTSLSQACRSAVKARTRSGTVSPRSDNAQPSQPAWCSRSTISG